jgi:hypothetical protein
LRLSCRTPRDTDDSIFTWLVEAKQTTPKPLRKGLGSAALLLPWMIWKHRNDCVFEGARPSVHDLMSKVKEEASLWAKAGAMGFRVALSATWDVHWVECVRCMLPPRRIVNSLSFQWNETQRSFAFSRKNKVHIYGVIKANLCVIHGCCICICKIKARKTSNFLIYLEISSRFYCSRTENIL